MPTRQERINLIQETLQEILQEENGEALLVRAGVVVWEATTFGEDGEVYFQPGYLTLEGTSPAASLGILEVGRSLVVRDLFEETSEND